MTDELVDHYSEMEAELYGALEALENDDLIGVRQCSARAQSHAVAAWQEKRQISHFVDSANKK